MRGSLAVEHLIGEFSCLSTSDELADMLIDVCQQLQQNPIKDADRAGERLLVLSARKYLNRFRWACSFGIIGEESSEEYFEFTVRNANDKGLLKTEPCERLELMITAWLRAVLNGARRFSTPERQALTEAASIALKGSDGLPVRCGYCEKAFLFWEDAVEHEKAVHPEQMYNNEGGAVNSL